MQTKSTHRTGAERRSINRRMRAAGWTCQRVTEDGIATWWYKLVIPGGYPQGSQDEPLRVARECGVEVVTHGSRTGGGSALLWIAEDRA